MQPEGWPPISEASEFVLELADSYPDMPSLYADVDRNLHDLLQAHAREGVETTCRKGCDACCQQLVMATVAEARVAAAQLESADLEVKRRMNAWLLATTDLRARLQEVDGDDDLETRVEAIAALYWQTRIVCPFLVDSACSIYEGRPLACRHHFSASEPALCKEADTAIIDRPDGLDDAFFMAQDVIPEDQAQIGIFPELVVLALRGEL